ncbi:11869_t:CDS:2 [Rhizophagus irregularis]|nr:11869_t:CDS:2 [Rhizophagus irregularis]
MSGKYFLHIGNEDTTFSCPSEDLLDRCGCDIHNKEDATFSCPSDDLLDRYG